VITARVFIALLFTLIVVVPFSGEDLTLMKRPPHQGIVKLGPGFGSWFAVVHTDEPT